MTLDPQVREAQERDPAFVRICKGKIKHPTRELAEAAIRSMRHERIREKGHTLKAYRCHYGEHWHVGNSSTKKARRRRKQGRA